MQAVFLQMFDQLFQKRFVSFVVQLSVPFQIGPLAAHAHTGDEFQTDLTGMGGSQLFCCGSQSSGFAAVGSGTQFQCVQI